MCSHCDKLLERYRDAVKRYSEAAHELGGLLGDDFTRAFREVEKLRTSCGEARDELIQHFGAVHDEEMPGA